MRYWALVLAVLGVAGDVRAAELRMQDAVEMGITNYPLLASKKNQLEAATALQSNARRTYLPDVTAAIQQTYGTVNGWYGPQLPIGISAISSAGPTFPEQNWNSSFGANYLLSGSWEFFTFGRISSRIDLADAVAKRASADVDQETFVHCVRVAGAYLDLLIARQLKGVAESNLERTDKVLDYVTARANSGLVPDVDRSVAEADQARARIDVINARDREQQLSQQLAFLLNSPTQDFVLDGTFITRLPDTFTTDAQIAGNPQLRFQEARIIEAEQTALTTKRSAYPGFNLVGALQARASGFDENYSFANQDHDGGWWDGVRPQRANYVVGVTLAWNLASPFKVGRQTEAQNYLASAARNDFNLVSSQLDNQLKLSERRIENAREATREVPRQYSAAQAAYVQRTALYNNGLATIVDVQQALNVLNRAEADRSTVNLSLWQALLQKAAATGDFNLFLSQARVQ